MTPSKLTRGLLLAIAAFVLLVALAPSAEAADASGCTRVVHHNGVDGWRAYKLEIGSTTPDASTPCPTNAPPQIIAGTCATWISGVYESGTPPSAPTDIEVRFFQNDSNNDHGVNGISNWGDFVRKTDHASLASWNGSSHEVCGTQSGISGNAPRTVTYRATVRVCSYVPANCESVTRVYDINTDPGSSSGSAGSGYTVTDAQQGKLSVREFYLGDPLYLDGPETPYLGQAVSFSIKAEWDNGTARTGAASNLTFWLDCAGSWAVENANPTERTFPDGTRKGFYYYNWTPSAVGECRGFVNATTSLNETRSSKPFVFTVVSPPLTLAKFEDIWTEARGAFSVLNYTATKNESREAWTDLNATRGRVNLTLNTTEFREAWPTLNATAKAELLLSVLDTVMLDDNASLAELLSNIQDTNNTSSGALSFATFNLWRSGEWRPTAEIVNGTAREDSVRQVRNNTAGALDAIHRENAETRNHMLESRVATAWTAMKPANKEQGLVLALGLALVLYGVRSGLQPRSRGSAYPAQTIVAGIVLLAVWSHLMGWLGS